MPLSEGKLAAVRSYLQGKGANGPCSACGNNAFAVADIVTAPVMPEGGGIALGGPSVPMVQVVCSRCGCIRFFAAMPMGIVGGGTET